MISDEIEVLLQSVTRIVAVHHAVVIASAPVEEPLYLGQDWNEKLAVVAFAQNFLKVGCVGSMPSNK